MKKLITKLSTVLVLVALLATGVVLTATASTSTQPKDSVSNAAGADRDLFVLPGTRYTDSTTGWQTGTLKGKNALDGVDFSAGDAYWWDFDYYWDETTVDDIEVRIRNSDKPIVFEIDKGKIGTDTSKFTESPTTYKFPGYGWHHISAKYFQTYTESEGTYTYRYGLTLYVNGEEIGTSYVKDTAWWTSKGLHLYSRNADNTGFAMNGGFYTYIYSSQKAGAASAANTDKYSLLRDLSVTCYTDEQHKAAFPIAPIKYTGMTDFVRDEVITTEMGDAVATPKNYTPAKDADGNYLSFNIISAKWYYTYGQEQTLTLPGANPDGSIFYGWFADANYTQPITSVTVAADDADGQTVYARVINKSYAAYTWTSGSVYIDNQVASLYNGLQMAEVALSPDASNVKPLWIEFDYYADLSSGSEFEFRFVDPDAYNDAKEAGLNPQTWTYKAKVFGIKNGVLSFSSTFFGEGNSVELGGEGWHHISVKYAQNASYTDGAVKVDYIFTAYVDGVEALSATVTSERFAKEFQYDLFKVSYDEESEKLVYTANDNLKIYYYCAGIFNNTTPRVYSVGDLYLTYDDSPVFGSYSPIRYHLNGGSLENSTIDGWVSGIVFTKYRLFPLKADGTLMTFASDAELAACAAKSYASYQFSVSNALHYYTPGTEYVLPVATIRGMDFIGWYDNPEFTGDPITAIPASQVGKVELYAKFEGQHTVTLKDGDSESVVGKYNAYKLPSDAAYWINPDDGAIYAAGEEVTLFSDSVFYAIRVTLRDGASIRLNAAHSGLRFESAISAELLALLDDMGYGIAFGTIVAPTDKISGAFTAEALGEGNYVVMDAANGTVFDEGGEKVFYASLIDILAKNYTRAFSAVSYLDIDTGDGVIRIYADYSAENNSRSVYEVAKAAYADVEYGYTEGQLSIIKTFIDGVLVLSVEGGEISVVTEVDGYTSPYAVSYADGVITVTKSAEQTLSTVILEGTAYTKGWTVAEDGLSVSIPYTVEVETPEPGTEETPAE